METTSSCPRHHPFKRSLTPSSGVQTGYGTCVPDPRREPPIDDLAEEAVAENPDPVTRRETFELDLQERGRSKEGEEVDLTDVADQ